MKKAFLLGAMVGALGCSATPKKTELPSVMEGVPIQEDGVSKLLKQCQDQYREFFFQEICFHNERNGYDGKHYVPEVVSFAHGFSHVTYKPTELDSYRLDIADKVTAYREDCMKELGVDLKDEVPYKCYEYALYKLLVDSEKNLNKGGDSELMKKDLFVYFYVLNIWLTSI